MMRLQKKTQRNLL